MIHLSEKFLKLGSSYFISRLIDIFKQKDNVADNEDEEGDFDNTNGEEILPGITHADEKYPVFSTTNANDRELLDSSNTENNSKNTTKKISTQTTQKTINSI